MNSIRPFLLLKFQISQNAFTPSFDGSAKQLTKSKTISLLCLTILLLNLIVYDISDISPILTTSSRLKNPASNLANTAQPIKQNARIAEQYGQLPMSFEVNQGQLDAQVKFFSRGQGYTLYFTSNQFVFSLQQPQLAPESNPGKKYTFIPGKLNDLENNTLLPPSIVKMNLVGANANPEIKGLEELPGISNYFIGNDPSKWHINVPKFGRVQYQAVYPGIDVVFYGNQHQLEYDFIVSPGADPAAIRFSFQNVDNLEINEKGDLVLKTSNRELVQPAPKVYQEINGVKNTIAGNYRILPSEDGIPSIGFQTEKYDPTYPLIIDPIILYSTYLGGSAYEEGNGIAIDSQGNAYITGTTQSLDFPTQNPIQGTYKGNYDAFIAKLSATGNALLYSTYFGGSNDEYSRAITLDSSGSIYVTGTTASSDFPTQNPFQPSIGSNGNGNAYVLKLNPAGNQLMFSTYFGGSQGEDGNAIGIDVAGQVYIAGATNSPNLPTKNPLQANLRGISDAFIAKFNANGTALIYSTYLGGSQTDYVMGLAVDGTGAAYLTGGTASTDFPVQNPLQPTLAGGGDAYITKINPAGTVLVYSTYLGGSDASNVGSEYGTAIAVDNIGNAYVTGVTSSADFPLANPYQSIFAGHADDAFVTKINSSGNAPLSSNGTGFTVSSKCSV